MSNWNKYNQDSASYGGMVPIWVNQPSRAESGGFLTSTNLVEGEILSAGSPVEFNPLTHAAKILRIFKVKATAVVDTNTTITVYRMGNLPLLHNGDIVQVLGSTLAATGKAVAVADIDNSVDGETSFTVVTTAIDTVAEGAYLVQSASASAGSGKSIYCTPNSLTIEDTVIGDQNSVGIAVGPKYIYENTAPWLPTIVKAAIPMLETAKFAEMQGSGYVS